MPVKTRNILILSLIAALAIFSGCGGGDSSSSESGTTPGTALPARTLSWEPPTSYVDATPMNPVTELDQFEIYVNETGAFTDKDLPTASLGAVDPQTRRAAPEDRMSPERAMPPAGSQGVGSRS